MNPRFKKGDKAVINESSAFNELVGDVVEIVEFDDMPSGMGYKVKHPQGKCSWAFDSSLDPLPKEDKTIGEVRVGYKVFNVRGGQLVSTNVGGVQRLTYKVGEMLAAPENPAGYGIFVCRDFKEAQYQQINNVGRGAVIHKVFIVGKEMRLYDASGFGWTCPTYSAIIVGEEVKKEPAKPAEVKQEFKVGDWVKMRKSPRDTGSKFDGAKQIQSTCNSLVSWAGWIVDGKHIYEGNLEHASPPEPEEVWEDVTDACEFSGWHNGIRIAYKGRNLGVKYHEDFRADDAFEDNGFIYALSFYGRWHEVEGFAVLHRVS